MKWISLPAAHDTIEGTHPYGWWVFTGHAAPDLLNFQKSFLSWELVLQLPALLFI
jgi:hypothetical protein